MFRQCPNPGKLRNDGKNSSHDTLLHGSERVYPSKFPSTNNNRIFNPGASHCKPPSVQSLSRTTTLSTVSNVKGLLQVQVTELQLTSAFCKDTTALVLLITLGCPVILQIDFICTEEH